MTRSTRLSIALAVLVCTAGAACAPRRAPTVPAAPKFPSYVFPGVPGALAAQTALADRHNAGWAYLQSGDLRAAEREFSWVTEQLSTFFPSEVGRGYVALAQRDYDEALEHFELGLAVASNYPSGLVGRGEALLALGRAQEALASFEAALAADPTLTELRTRVDSLRFRSLEDEIATARRARDAGRYEEAVGSYTRALAASPESGFLHREIAVAEQRLGKLDAALSHAKKATELDPTDARAHIVAGEVLEAQRRFAEALAEYEVAAALEPGEELSARIEALRERAALATLPPEFQNIEAEPAISRAQLAALIGVRLTDLVTQAGLTQAAVITDIRSSWAAPWIDAVVSAGVMDVYPNHTFQPSALVRRGDLAAAVSRLLSLATGGNPAVTERWRAAHVKFSDLPPAHLSYPAAAMSVEAGVLDAPDGAFHPGRPVSGAEALDALERIDGIWRRRVRRM
jgi:tetratricopeptide (TPR) repeat protein